MTKKTKKPLPHEAQFTNPVQVNFTDEQKLQVVAAASSTGMALATFIRVAAVAAAQPKVQK